MRQEEVLTQSLLQGDWTPREQKQRLFILLAEKLKRVSDASLYAFTKYVLGYSDMAIQPHWEICDFIQRYLWEDMLILAPRGCFKSTIGSVGLPLWLFTKDKNLRIMSLSWEMDYTKGWLAVGKQHLESNRTFRLLYGDLVPHGEGTTDTWRTDRIKLTGRTLFRVECSWIASSIKTSETSQHYDMVIIDDPVNEMTRRNPEIMAQINQSLNVVAPLIDPFTRPRVGRTTPWSSDPGQRGPRMLFGTRWHFSDPYGRIEAEERQRRRAREPREWREYCKPAVNSAGKLYFPTRHTKAFLAKMKKTLGAELYSCLYMNDPLPDESKVYKLHNLGFYNERYRRTAEGEIFPMPTNFVYITILDPSRGETASSAYSAFDTVGISTDNEIYVMEVIRDRIVGNEGLIETLFQIRHRWKPIKIGIESFQFQKGIYHSFKAQCVERGEWFHIHPLEGETHKSKDMRIEDFAEFAQTRGLYLRVRDGTDLTLPPEDLYYALVPGQDFLATEMLHFPLGETKDCIDALAWLPKLVVPGPAAPKKKPKAESFEALFPHLFRGTGKGVPRIGTR